MPQSSLNLLIPVTAPPFSVRPLYMRRRICNSYLEAAALDIWYFSLLPSYENEESATSLAWLRHAVRVNQTGMELQPMQPVPLFQFG